MKRHLTDRFCAGAKPREGEAQTDYFDTQVSGLALRVGKGHKSWSLHYTLGAKRRRLTFGAYPFISLSAARTRADEAKALVASGHDPRLAATETLQHVCELYMAHEGTKLRSAGWRKGVLDRHIYPVLGARPIAEIRRSEVVGLLDRIEARSGPVMATQTLAVLRKVMNWHATRSDDFLSPIVKGMARTKPSERARERVLSDDELRKVWQAAKGVYGAYLRFLLLTAARRSEVAGMTWAEINGGDWTLPGARNKTKVDLVRPLSPTAQATLGPKATGFVWSANGAKAITDLAGFKRDLDAATGVKGWRFHDLRRTARSLMSRAGVPSDHAERCLGHVMPGVRGTYDRHEYYEEKRRAFEALASLVERIVNPQPNVLSIRAKQ
jgi:integrase